MGLSFSDKQNCKIELFLFLTITIKKELRARHRLWLNIINLARLEVWGSN
jgi:hypothetical protein